MALYKPTTARCDETVDSSLLRAQASQSQVKNRGKAMRKYAQLSKYRTSHGSKNRIFKWQEAFDHRRAI